MTLFTSGKRFELQLTVIEGGSGIIRGTLSETDQQALPVFTFVSPRHTLRTSPQTALRSSMVLRSPAGEIFIVGENGHSEQRGGAIWQSWFLFKATDSVTWERRNKVTDPVTLLDRDDGHDDLGTFWMAYEPLDRKPADFRMNTSFEQARFICGAAVQVDDVVDGRKVTRADHILGVTIGVLT